MPQKFKKSVRLNLESNTKHVGIQIRIPTMNMKHIPTIGILIAAATFATAQNENQSTDKKPADQKTLQIVFVPKELAEKNIASGKLKEDTFFWNNGTNNTEKTPTAKTEDGVAFLQIKPILPPAKGTTSGYFADAATESRTGVHRAFTIPENATKAVISYNIRMSYDPWEHPQISPFIAVKTLFTNNGKQVGTDAGLSINREDMNKGWVSQTKEINILPGAQQILLSFTTNAAVTLDIAGLNAEFK